MTSVFQANSWSHCGTDEERSIFLSKIKQTTGRGIESMRRKTGERREES